MAYLTIAKIMNVESNAASTISSWLKVFFIRDCDKTMMLTVLPIKPMVPTVVWRTPSIQNLNL
jgi:hypothetical protein